MEALASLCANPKLISSCLKDWNKFGLTNFIQQSKDDIDTCIQNLSDLFIKLISGDGKVDIINKLIPELLKIFNVEEFSSRLADVLWMLDVTISDITDAQAKERFLKVLSICNNSIDSSLLMERLSDETLEQISLISSHSQTRTRYVRIKTRLFYKQQKFNLLREESEGYAKLMIDLSNTPVGSAEGCLTHVRSLIGYFDLDPNRVLDIIFDVFEIRREAVGLFIDLLRLYNPDKIDSTNILGHKFQFYQERESITPESLHRLAALLISYNLVDVDILLAHLLPSDATIHVGRTKSIRDAKSWRPAFQSSGSAIQGSLDNFIATGNSTTVNGGGGSILGDAPSRSLPSNPGSSSTAAFGNGGSESDNWNGGAASVTTNGKRGGEAGGEEMEEKGEGWSPENENEVFDCGEFQFANNQKLDLCAALVNLGDWKAAQKILDRFPGHWIASHPSLNRAICDLVHYLIDPLYESNSTLPPSLLKKRRKPASPELFQNPDSASRLIVQQATNFTSLAREVLPIVGYLGPYLSHDVVLMVKLCRTCSVYVADLMSKNGPLSVVYQAVFNMLDEAILPSLTMVSSNCCLAEEVWKLVKHFPYEHRYRLYGQWKHTGTQGEPAIIRKRAVILLRTKALMKRLSKENVKQLGRHLGKLSHSNPGVLFDFMLHNIQMFTNLITPVVDSLKYVSNLGYDVLAFSLIEALASDKNKAESIEMGSTLHALATFTGALCRKYQFDLAGILQYVLNQLKVGRSEDLLILQEIIHQMAGLDSYEEMTDEQLEAATGGEILLQEGGYYSQIRNARRNANRLKEALIENKVIMPLIFLMARQRDAILYIDDPERHVKTAGRLYDECQGTLVQFITFLGLQLTREEMQGQCFSLEQMMKEYSVPADTAFCLYRSLFLQNVAQLFESLVEKSDDDDKSVAANRAAYVKAAHTVVTNVARSVEPLYPPRVWVDLDPAFFATFWCLESGDLVFPSAAYQRQRNALRSQMDSIETNVEMTSDKKRREKERCQTLLNRLAREQDQRKVHVDRIRAWLLTERNSWFQSMSATKMDTVAQFLQYCIYPRVFYTASDAVYAAQFIQVLHQLKTTQFATLICLDRIFNDITLPVSICTEKEAHRYGRFLCKVLEFVMRWHSSEEIFNQECGQYPGFVTVFRKGPHSNTKADQLQFENYRHVVHKWHYRMTKAAVACLESGNYAQIRNALIVLIRILPYYPKVDQFGMAVERRVNKLKESEKDKRPDLKVIAFSYAGMLRPLKDSWVAESQIHLKEQRPEPVAISLRNPPSAANASQQQQQGQTTTASSSSANAASLGSQTTTKSSSQFSESVSTSTPIANATGTVNTSTVAPKSAGNTPTGTKTTKTPVTTSAQKRVAPFESGNSPLIEHISSDELREGKHRRTASDRAHSAKRARVTESSQQQQQQVDEDSSPASLSSKDLRRMQRKRSGNATGVDVDVRGGMREGVYSDLDDMHAANTSLAKRSKKAGLSGGRGLPEESSADHRGRRRSPAGGSSGSHRHHRSTHRGTSEGSPPSLAAAAAAQMRHARK
nr:tho complex subunit 2 [Hymenolepis microstoma]